MKLKTALIAITILSIALCTQEIIQQQNQGGDPLVYDEEQGRKFAAFSQAAYCRKSKIEKWKCGPPCKQYFGLEEITVLQSSNKVNQGYVAYYPADDAILIAWKGTIKIRQWLEDFDFVFKDYPACEYCKVHEGFWKAYQSMEGEFWTAFGALRENHPNSQIYLTGHSLGAAISVFSAADLIQHGITDFVFYNFGQPRPGNQAFADWLTSSLTNRLFRVTHHKDPVPHLPPKEFGFRHPPQEIFYVHHSAPADEHIDCDPNNGEDPNCSDQYALDLNVIDHVQYEGWQFIPNIAGCLI